MSTIYAIAFVQNTMTTGLLAWRIWRANRASQQLTYVVRVLSYSCPLGSVILMLSGH